jgi:hypothetical protein
LRLRLGVKKEGGGSEKWREFIILFGSGRGSVLERDWRKNIYK